ncbi:MAG: aspartyl-phosphate phosphatase Spo0E family protein [Thermaerobacter sp.]|nr:aspartyl-phosphate phosphatase Spo0E family protein [Thermaerobacter sp.]
MTTSCTYTDYLRAIRQIKTLKAKLWMAASTKGNLDPEVIAISQDIDGYVVVVQNYWRSHRDKYRLG